MKTGYNLNDKFYFKWTELVNSIRKTWNKVLKEIQSDSSISVLIDHHFFKNNCILWLDKTNPKDIYSVITSSLRSFYTNTSNSF